MRIEDIEILLGSPLNDPDLVQRARDALEQYGPVRQGIENPAIDGMPLSCFFDSEYYSGNNPDVVAAGYHPYLHFLLHGIGEGRNPHPLIDLAFLRKQFPAMAQRPLTPEALADALDNLQLDPHCYFDTAHYESANPDVRDSGMSALRHYLRHGAEEGRLPHPRFDHARYIAAVQNAPRGFYEAFVHCVRHQPGAGGLDDAGNDASPTAGTPLAGPGGRMLAGDAPVGVQGWLDQIVDGVAYGWAHDTRQPFKRLDIEIVEDRRIVGRGPAMLYRNDLHEGGHGDGRCAFAIKLSKALFDGESHLLWARVGDGSGIALNGEHVHASPAASPAFDMLPAAEVVGLAEDWSAHWQDRDEARAFVSSMERSNLQLETDDIRQGLDALETIAARYPDLELVQIKIGEALLAMNRPEAAMAAYQRALEGDSLTSWTLLGIGNCYRLLGRWDEAKDFYLRGLAISPDKQRHGARVRELDDRLRTIAARRFLDEGDTGAALDALLPQLLNRPDDARLKSLVGEVLDVERSDGVDIAGTQLDSEMSQARQSIALLQVVVDYCRKQVSARA